MNDRSYIGIDSTDNDEWILAVCHKEIIILSNPFQNTPAELIKLVRFIEQHCNRPKICLTSSNPKVLNLIKLISSIPNVEVVLMSHAGLKLHQAWLPTAITAYANQNYSSQAPLLAYCAERVA